MRYIRVHGPSPPEVLSPIAGKVDACWWHVGGKGFVYREGFHEQPSPALLAADPQYNRWLKSIDQLVEEVSPVGYVGKPGFFAQLGNSLNLDWACYFAIESDSLPLTSLLQVEKESEVFFAPFASLPPDVVLALRDIDSGYQEYGFRDEWLFDTVFAHLRFNMRCRADEITDWPI
jgi:hypothetical protein